jgi:hypothetical protein
MTTEPQRLTYEQCVAACRAAFDDGTLLAEAYYRDMGSIPDQAACVYDDFKGHRCAVGVALEPRTIAAAADSCLMNSSVNALCNHELVWYTPDEGTKIWALQQAHDEWIWAMNALVRGEYRLETVVRQRDAFKKLIGYPRS